MSFRDFCTANARTPKAPAGISLTAAAVGVGCIPADRSRARTLAPAAALCDAIGFRAVRSFAVWRPLVYHINGKLTARAEIAAGLDARRPIKLIPRSLYVYKCNHVTLQLNRKLFSKFIVANILSSSQMKMGLN
jgi:hypothetical protein